MASTYVKFCDLLQVMDVISIQHFPFTLGLHISLHTKKKKPYCYTSACIYISYLLIYDGYLHTLVVIKVMWRGNKRFYNINYQDGTLATQLWFIHNRVTMGFQWTMVHLSQVLTAKSCNPISRACSLGVLLH